ncbi:MAG: DUF6261 family protein [Mediterranea sp.]|jgi:hypothetical protein|nr:DUF6261 family protein [Mediterranea sp.]
MNNAAHHNFHLDMLTIIKADKTVCAQAAKQLQVYEQAFEAEELARSISRKSFFTDAIAQGDKERDALYRTLQSNVKNFSKLNDPTTQNACKLLTQALKDYSVDADNQLSIETGGLVSLLNDLRGKYKDEVEALSLTHTVNLLYEANEKVRLIMLARNKEAGGKPAGAMRNARVILDKAYIAFAKYLNASVLMEETDIYDPCIIQMNATIKYYAENILRLKPSTLADKNGNGELPAPISPTPPGTGNTPGESKPGDEEIPDPIAPPSTPPGGGSSGAGDEYLPDPLS